jgi:hypothetical protein
MIAVAPTVRIDLASRLLEVKEGERLELRCEVTGYPPPAVQWHRQVATTHFQLCSGTDRYQLPTTCCTLAQTGTSYPPPAVKWHRQVAATHHLLYSSTDRY